MADDRAYYVVFQSGDGWGVKLEEGRYMAEGFSTQRRATIRAKAMAKDKSNAGNKVVINRKDGATRRHIGPYYDQ